MDRMVRSIVVTSHEVATRASRKLQDIAPKYSHSYPRAQTYGSTPPLGVHVTKA